MKFDEKTAADLIYISTHDAVTAAIRELTNGAIMAHHLTVNQSLLLILESIYNNEIPFNNTVQV